MSDFLDMELTDKIGDLTTFQADHLARGLEVNFDCSLRSLAGGGYWLTILPEGGSILMVPSRTVGHVWEAAKTIAAWRDAK